MNVRIEALIVVVLILTEEISAQAPEIVNEIWPEVQQVSRTGRLNCTIARLGENTVTWSLVNGKTRNGKTISIGETIYGINKKFAGQYKYQVEVRLDVDRVTFMLVIRRLVETDAGIYKCTVRIQRAQDNWVSKSTSLTVLVPPTINSDSDAVKELQMLENATLKCGASGIPAPNITWTRSDGGLLPIYPKEVAQFRGANLRLHNVAVRHMGVYRCVADNNVKPPSEHLCEVRVFHSPRTAVVQNSVGQAKNRAAKMECLVQGHPVPTVTWYRIDNGTKVQVNDDDHFTIHKQTQDIQNLRAMEQWYTLKIPNVLAKHYTTFICKAVNKMGSDQSEIVLFETTECQGSNCPSLSVAGTAARVVEGPVLSLMLMMFLSVVASC